MSEIDFRCNKIAENIEEALVDSKRAKYDRIEMKIEIKDLYDYVQNIQKKTDNIEIEIEDLRKSEDRLK